MLLKQVFSNSVCRFSGVFAEFFKWMKTYFLFTYPYTQAEHNKVALRHNGRAGVLNLLIATPSRGRPWHLDMGPFHYISSQGVTHVLKIHLYIFKQEVIT